MPRVKSQRGLTCPEPSAVALHTLIPEPSAVALNPEEPAVVLSTDHTFMSDTTGAEEPILSTDPFRLRLRADFIF